MSSRADDRRDRRERSRSRSHDRPHRDDRDRRSRSRERDRGRDGERYEERAKGKEREDERRRSPVRRRSASPRRSRSRDKYRRRSRSRSRSSSADRYRSRRSDRRRSRSRSRSRSVSSSSSVSSDEKRHKKKHKHKRKRSRSRDREKKERKKEKKEKKKKKLGAVGHQWGKYGIINETDLYNKEPEFRAWLVEERIINPETISKEQTRKEFAKFVEDFNTATLPHEKFYDITSYERRMTALRSGEFVPPPDDTYDPNADMRALQGAHKRKQKEDVFMSRDQLMELRKVQAERIEAGKMKLLGMEIKQNMGVRMDGTMFDD